MPLHDVSNAPPGVALAVVKYAPASLTTYNVTNTSGLTALDATNLTVSFAAPDSGSVLVTFIAPMTDANWSGGQLLGIGLLNHVGGAQVGETQTNICGATAISEVTVVWYLTGLTPGANLGLDIAAGVSNGGTAHVYAQGATGAANAGKTGPALIVVQAA